MNIVRSLLLNEDSNSLNAEVFDEPTFENFKPVFNQNINRLRKILFTGTNNDIVKNYQVDQAISWCLADPISEQILKTIDPINTYSRFENKWFSAVKTFDESTLNELNSIRNVVLVDSMLFQVGVQNWNFVLNNQTYSDLFNSAKQLIRTVDLPVRRVSATILLCALEII